MSSGTSDHKLVLIETFQKFLSSTFQYLNHLEYKPITPGYIPPFLGSLLRPSLKSKTQNSVLKILICVDQTLLKILKNSYFSISCATEIGESPGATQYPFYFKSMWEKMPIARLSDLHRVKQPTTQKQPTKPITSKQNRTRNIKR